MTIPSERTRAVLRTEQFLLRLVDRKSPRVPTWVREEAKHLLRHYPTRYEMAIVAEHEEKVDAVLAPRIFGRVE